MEVDRSGVNWTHAFVGNMTLAVASRETGRAQAIPLCEGQVARVEDRTTERLVTVKDHAAKPDLFAHLTIMPAGALANGGKWLKEIDADPGVPLIAVGSEPEPDWGRQPAADWTLRKGAGSRGLGGTGSESGTPTARTKIRSGVINTCRVTFKITDMVPATVVLQGRFAAVNHVTAMRLNGKTLEGPRQIDEDATRQSGTFAIRCGFVEGENVWEIDVNNTPPGTSLVVCPQLSGIRPPRQEASAEAFARGKGRETTTEVR